VKRRENESLIEFVMRVLEYQELCEQDLEQDRR